MLKINRQNENILMAYYYISRKFTLKFLSTLVIFSLFSFIPEKSKMEGILFENDSVVISSRIEQCFLPKDGTENVNVLLSVRNKTSHKIKVSFQEELSYDEKCLTCGSDEYRYSVEVEANSVKEATCENKLRGMAIFHHMPNGMTKTVLTDLKLTGVTITDLK